MRRGEEREQRSRGSEGPRELERTQSMRCGWNSGPFLPSDPPRTSLCLIPTRPPEPPNLRLHRNPAKP
eukprot:2090901-Rhodomonas_salina.2